MSTNHPNYAIRLSQDDTVAIQGALVTMAAANADQQHPDAHLALVIDQVLQRLQHRAIINNVPVPVAVEKVVNYGDQGEHRCDGCSHGRQAHSASLMSYSMAPCTTLDCDCECFTSQVGPLTPTNDIGPPDRGYQEYIPSSAVQIEIDDIMSQFLD